MHKVTDTAWLVPSGRLNAVLYNNWGSRTTDKTRLRNVPATRLWDILLKWRVYGDPVHPYLSRTLDLLHQSGLKDPFEEKPEIKEYVAKLFERYRPKNELDKALLFFRAVIPPTKLFNLGNMNYSGLATNELGLTIPYNDDCDAPLRKKHGTVLPIHNIRAYPEERVALCLEYSFLLVALLRTAGIDASVKQQPRHAFVIADLDGIKYKLDAAQLKFTPTTEEPSSDREIIATCYFNYGFAQSRRKNTSAALEAYRQALEIDPKNARAWYNLGSILHDEGRFEEAIEAYNKTLELDPKYYKARVNKQEALDSLATLRPPSLQIRTVVISS